MIRNLILMTLIGVLITSCEAGTEKKEPVATTPVPQPEPSLSAFTDTLQKLDKNAPVVIEHAVELYDVLAPYDSTGADSAAAALVHFINDVVKRKNDSLHTGNEDFSWFNFPTDSTLTESQKAAKSSLYAARLKPVSDGEGGAYLVPSYETILPTIKARTTAAVDDYLDLVAKEDTTPVFLDAGLAIELPELADRLATSEKLLNQPLPRRFATEAEQLNVFYRDALLFGADNSPSIEYNSTRLNEEFRKGYDYLLAKYPSSKAASLINVWIAVVASGDAKKIEAFRNTQR